MPVFLGIKPPVAMRGGRSKTARSKTSMGDYMGFKTLALAGAATAALSLGIAAPAMADTPSGHGCHLACKNLPIMKDGVKYGYVNVWVHGKSIHGVVHVQKTMQPGAYTFRGHCVRTRPVHETTTVFRHTEVRTVPTGPARTGFGGAGHQAGLPLTVGALSVIAGGLGLGGLAARRRLSSVRS